MSANKSLLPWHRKIPNEAKKECDKLEKEAKEECYKLNEFFEEFKRSGILGEDYRRWYWKKSVEKYIQEGRPISIKTIDKIWNHLNRNPSGEVSKPFCRDAVRILFDFSTTAITYDDTDPLNHAGKCHEDQNARQPRGMALQQKVFLTDLEAPIVAPEPKTKPGELDRFAMAIADLNGYDGVYCLSGVRGSGKSSVLNRIAWYCQHWFDRTQRPLLVRFDLGTTFNREIFVRDLLAEICLTAKRTLRQNPFSSPFGMGWAVRAIGYLGRFCQVNMLWAIVVAILLIIFMDLMDPSVSTNSADSISQKEKLLYGLLGSVILGIAYYANSWIVNYFQSKFRNSQRSPFEYLCNIVVFIALLVILVLFVSSTNILSRWLPENNPFFPESFGNHDPFILSFIGLFVAILVLPRWWQRYVYLDRILSRVRSDQSLRLHDMPLLAPMGFFSEYLARFLPTSESSEKLDEISEPFIQELIKQALNECTKIFPRVVILVDDVDALPSTEFHSVMRLFRPMSKVAGVRCIMTTPLYFHYVLGERNLSDFHSTIQRSIVVGNPTIIDHWPMEPDKITDNTEMLKEFLVDLVVSRLRMNLRDKDDKEIILASPVFNFILEPWLQNDNKIKELFDRFGTSRREIVRVLYEMNENFQDTLNPKAHSELMKNYGNALSDLKKQYMQQEAALNCNNSDQMTPSGQVIPKRTPRRRSTPTGSKGQSKSSP